MSKCRVRGCQDPVRHGSGTNRKCRSHFLARLRRPAMVIAGTEEERLLMTALQMVRVGQAIMFADRFGALPRELKSHEVKAGARAMVTLGRALLKALKQKE